MLPSGIEWTERSFYEEISDREIEIDVEPEDRPDGVDESKITTQYVFDADF